MDFNEIMLVQKFGHSISSIDIAISDDERYLVSAGVYKPSIKIYDLNNLSLKAERHLESDPIKVVPLTEDATKLCVLRNDKKLEFHAKYGRHENVLIPNLCFDICLNKFRAEIIVGGVGTSVHRFNLEQGRFLSSYPTVIEEVRSICLSAATGLIAISGENKIQFIDSRKSTPVKTVEYNESPSAIAFSGNGLDFGVGTREGVVYFHDLRARKELFRSEHGTEIKKVLFNGRILISINGNTVKFCCRDGILGEYGTESEVNSFARTNGVFFVALENGDIKIILSTMLGENPPWYKVL